MNKHELLHFETHNTLIKHSLTFSDNLKALYITPISLYFKGDNRITPSRFTKLTSGLEPILETKEYTTPKGTTTLTFYRNQLDTIERTYYNENNVKILETKRYLND